MSRVRKPSEKRKQALLAITGMPGCGKGEAARVAKSMGYPVVSFGDVIRDEVERRKLPPTPVNMAAVSNWFHKSREPLMVKRLLKKIPKSAHRKRFIVLDGPRSPGQMRLLKKNFNVYVLAIVLPDKLRRRRQLARGRPDLGTMRDVLARDRREASYGIKKVIAGADRKISNARSMSEFRGKLRKFFKEFEKSAQSI
jgi:dephospho-CoA kinase